MEVQCEVEMCEFNVEGTCNKPVITINSNKICEDYEYYKNNK